MLPKGAPYSSHYLCFTFKRAPFLCLKQSYLPDTKKKKSQEHLRLPDAAMVPGSAPWAAKRQVSCSLHTEETWGWGPQG